MAISGITNLAGPSGASTALYVSGSGTVNVLLKGNGSSQASDSSVTDNGTTVNSSDAGGYVGAAYSSNTANVASAGQVRLASADTIKWRNNANGADVAMSKTGAASGSLAADAHDLSGFGAVSIPVGAVGAPAILFSGQTAGIFWQATWGTSFASTATSTDMVVIPASGPQLQSGGFLRWSNSSTNAGTTGQTFLGSGAAATIRFGFTDAAVPVAQTLIFQGSRGGTDSNTAGVDATIKCSLGTGTAQPKRLIVSQGVYGASGTAAHTAVKRNVLGHTSAAVITNNTATTVVTSAAANASDVGVMIRYCVIAKDATNTQSEIGMATFSGIVNNAGTQTLAAVVKAANAQAVSAGTLAVTWTSVTNGATVDIKVTSNSSLTPTTHTVTMEIINLSSVNDITLV